MANQRIGFLLQRENYQNDNGEWKHQMNFFSCFHAQSELMAKEIIERKTTPEALPKSLASLMSNPITTRKPKTTMVVATNKIMVVVMVEITRALTRTMVTTKAGLMLITMMCHQC